MSGGLDSVGQMEVVDRVGVLATRWGSAVAVVDRRVRWRPRPAAARRYERARDLWRWPVPHRHGEGHVWSGTATARQWPDPAGLQLRVQPVVRVRQQVGLPPRASRELADRPGARRGARLPVNRVGRPGSLWTTAPRVAGLSVASAVDGCHPAPDGRLPTRLVGVPTDPGSAFGDSVNEQAAEDLVRFRHTRHCDPLDRGTHGAGCAMPAEHRW